jgi:hypothetical protein
VPYFAFRNGNGGFGAPLRRYTPTHLVIFVRSMEGITMGGEVIVTPWNSRPTEQDKSGHLHDCLWEMATEQAVLDRMKRTAEDFGTAVKKITPEDHMKQLDIICQDNGFRKFGSRGAGRDPNLVYDGEKIKVRIDPKEFTDSPPTVTNSDPVTKAYEKAVQSDSPDGGTDLQKKEKLNQWLQTIPGFEKLPDAERIALIEAYGRDGVDATKLTKLATTDDYKKLDADSRVRLLKLYGDKSNSTATTEIDKLLDDPKRAGRLKLLGSEGFTVLDASQQRRLLERYDSDKHFAAAIDKIVTQDNFTQQTGKAEAHALDILYRYSGRKGSGYGLRDEDDRTRILIGLYDKVLATKEFKLDEGGGPGKAESSQQSQKIDDFARDEVYDIADEK